MAGRVAVRTTKCREPIEDFTKTMWVGEKSLVNPMLRRQVTAFTVTMSTLMAVPAVGFHQLLMKFGLMQQFEAYCEEWLWRGICGRCGSLGHHFADACPDVAAAETSPRAAQEIVVSWCGGAGGACWPQMSARCLACRRPHTLSRDGDYEALEEAPAHEAWEAARAQAYQDLQVFMGALHLRCLVGGLTQHGIRSLKDLENIGADALAEVVAVCNTTATSNELIRRSMEPECVKEFCRSMAEKSRDGLATSASRQQHFLFLSHFKREAGTEASLMRAEIQDLMEQDAGLQNRLFDTPVFLDSENLSTLELLQNHVRCSHNVVVLLTTDVMLRPWVLVEMVTAIETGVPVVPVDIRKVGNDFNFPDDAFYRRLSAGKLMRKADQEVLRECGISLHDVEAALRHVFNKIALPYSPHRPASFRKTELTAILKECRLQSVETKEQQMRTVYHQRRSAVVFRPEHPRSTV